MYKINLTDINGGGSSLGIGGNNVLFTGGGETLTICTRNGSGAVHLDNKGMRKAKLDLGKMSSLLLAI